VRSALFGGLYECPLAVFGESMTVTVVDIATIAVSAALLAAFVAGLFVGARLTRSAASSQAANRPVGKTEVADLVLQLLREALEAVRELRSGQADESDRPELPPTRRKPRRHQFRSATNSESRKEG
jgi:hypothetical protein